MMKMGAVVLAAGLSKRMGRPKMTLPWGETTVIAQVATVLLEAGIGEPVVVTGGAREGVQRALAGMPVRTVFNPDYADGEMLRSLQVGLASLEPDIRAALVVLGDQPQIERSVVQSVMTAFMQGSHALVVPSFQRRRGHPWLLGHSLWDTLLKLQPPATMRQFLKRHAANIQYINVNTPSILQDLDTPADYRRFQSN